MKRTRKDIPSKLSKKQLRKQLRKSRKKILEEMNQKVRDAREKRAEDLVGEVEMLKMTPECSKQQKLCT